MVEARLSGGFSYAELRGRVRAGVATSRPPSPDLRIAAASVEKGLARVGTPAALHAVGVANMLVGDLDRAIPTLEQSLSVSDARGLSDLTAAYLARAARDNRPDDLTRALATADRAVTLDPSLPEGLFNRALALERLSRRDDARLAWREYLRVDDTSGWAREARSHLESLL
jgi:tetratricopeptide (TPR) repeat protein